MDMPQNKSLGAILQDQRGKRVSSHFYLIVEDLLSLGFARVPAIDHHLLGFLGQVLYDVQTTENIKPQRQHPIL